MANQHSSSSWTYLTQLAAALFLLVPAVRGEVVINEIHYDPPTKSDRTEFVELYNTGPGAVDLSGWRFTSGISYTFPAGTTLAADAYLLVGEDPARLSDAFGAVSLGPYLGFLSGEGERVRLRNASDEVVDEVEYGAGSPWPTDSAGEGSSMELIHPSLDNDLGGSWRASGTDAPVHAALLSAQSADWRYRKGTSEASSPIDAWRDLAFTEDITWLTGRTSIGYGDGDDYTYLGDMHGGYSTVYLRHELVIESASELAESYLLRVYVDDGCVVWINGHEVARVSVPSGTLYYDSTGNNHEAGWTDVPLSAAQAMLGVGPNMVAVHALNQSKTSSDFSIDVELQAVGSAQPGFGPSPGEQNRQWSTVAPPQARQIDHRPQAPTTNDPIVVTAKVTDPDGVQAVTLDYQLVPPGAYLPAWLPLNRTTLMNNPTLELSLNPDFTNVVNWTVLAMTDDGAGADEVAGDDLFTAVIPAQAANRTLVRYRVHVEDALGTGVRLPYDDDPSMNFACFVYNGVPAYTAQSSVSYGGSHTYSANDMATLPVYHVVTRYDDLMHAYAYDPAYVDWRISKGNLDARRKENWECAFVYDGVVYDHVRYRLRQSNDRYAQNGKRSMRFQFRKGNYLQARDHFGRKYPTRWRSLNTANGVRFSGSMNNVMPEGVNFQLFRMYGLPAPYTQMFQMRVVDGTDEAPAGADGQYYGDFYGYYLGFEDYDARFKDAHDLPDGNMYKLRDGWDNGYVLKKAQGRFSVTTVDDYNNIRDNLRPERSAAWLEEHVDYDRVYRYHAVVEGLRDYDTGFFGYDRIDNKNQVWLFDLEGSSNLYGRCGPHPHDTDATWSTGYPGTWGDSPFKKAVTDSGKQEYLQAFRNTYRDFRDLVWQEDVILPLIDEHAAFGRELSRADRDRWYNAPADAGHNEQATLDERVDAMKGFAFEVDYRLREENASSDPIPGGRAGALDIFAAEGGDDTSIPDTPTVTYTGVSNAPVNGLTFSCSAFSDPQGSNTFAAMVWRAGEVTHTNAPAYEPDAPWVFEVPAVWESPVHTGFTGSIQVPAAAMQVGHAYRVRVRMKDTSGRWSHWSPPVEFVAGPSDYAVALAEGLRVTEVMYHPAGGEARRDLEYIELQNIGTNLLNLDGVALTRGVDFDFGPMDLAPGAYVVVVRDLAAFSAAYPTNGIHIAGEYDGKLSDGGEQVRLRAAHGGAILAEFTYDDGRGWPLAPDGAGHALVPGTLDPQHTGLLDYGGNWRAGATIGGSPGYADPALPPEAIVLNELAAHTDYSGGAPWQDSNDWIELFNRADASFVFDVHWYLSDDAGELTKWNLPAGSLASSNWTFFTEVDDFHPAEDVGFGLDKAGEQVFLSYLPHGPFDRVVDAVRFKGQPGGGTSGRYEDGMETWRDLVPTPGAANLPGAESVVIDEMMYHPLPDTAELEYLEIVNRGPSPVSLWTNESLAWGGTWSDTWRIDGGIDYAFPPNTVIAAGQRIVLVAFDPNDVGLRTAFLAAYSLQEGDITLMGPYAGRLSNGGERVALERPQAPDEAGEGTSWIIVDEVIYFDGPPWITQGDGDGLALQRAAGPVWGRDPAAWIVGLSPSPGRAAYKVALSSPVNGTDLVTPSVVHLEARIDERLVEGATPQVEFFVDGQSLGVDTAAPFQGSFTCPDAPATYTFEGVLTDDAGMYTTAVSVITVHTNRPEVTLTGERVLNTLFYGDIALDGAVDLNGLPPHLVDTRWQQLSGPGTALFGNPTLPGTSVTFSQPGDYTLLLLTGFGGHTLTNQVLVHAVGVNGYNRIPYEEDFETFDPGRSIVGMLGWYGAGEDGGTIEEGSGLGAPGVPVLDQAHDRALRVGQTLVNRFADTETHTNVWFDALVDCRRWNEPVLPVVSSADQLALLVNSNGHLLVWHDQGGGDGWSEVPSVSFTNGQWVRVTVGGDFTPGAVSFRIWVDGTPVTSPVTVFAAAGTNHGSFGEVEVTGLTAVDDLVVEDYDVLRYRKVTTAAGPNGTVAPAGEILVPIMGGTNIHVTASNYYQASRIDVDGGAAWSGAEDSLVYILSNVVSRHDLRAWFDAAYAVHGVPHWWLAGAHPAWTNDFDAHALDDFDLDGSRTWQEYIADTDPTNELSRFHVRIRDAGVQPMAVDLVWGSATGRTYRAFSTTNLSSGVWEEGVELAGDGGEMSVRDEDVGDTPRHYRMDVRFSE